MTVRNLIKSPFLGCPAWNRGLKFDSCHFRGQNLREPLIQSTNGPIKLPGFSGWYSFLGRGTLLKEMSSRRRGGQPSKTPDPSTGRVTDSKAMHTCPCVCHCYSRRQMVCIPVCVFSLNEHLFMTPFIFSVFWWVFKLKWPYTQRLATFPPFWVETFGCTARHWSQRKRKNLRQALLTCVMKISLLPLPKATSHHDLSVSFFVSFLTSH